MTINLEDAVGLLNIAIDYLDEENWDDAIGCMEEAMDFISSTLTVAEEKLDEEE